MLKLNNIAVFNFDGAFRGLRNPKNSWEKSDSNFEVGSLNIGPNDLTLAQKMIGAGTDESKFLRQIFVTMDIEGPLYWWKEFDTYKVGTVSNSCSTMHTLTNRPITIEDFSYDYLDQESLDELNHLIIYLNKRLQQYKESGDKKDWQQLIQLLPSSWNQLRTISLNYQVLRNMYFARRYHKLDEWRNLCEFLKKLPYGEELICYEKEKKSE